MKNQGKIERIKEAKEETQRHLNKELGYMKINQNEYMISFYQKHLLKLNGMIEKLNAPIGFKKATR